MEKYIFIGKDCKVECDRFKTEYAIVDEIMEDYLKARCIQLEHHINQVLAMQQIQTGTPSDKEFLLGVFQILSAAAINSIKAETTTMLQCFNTKKR